MDMAASDPANGSCPAGGPVMALLALRGIVSVRSPIVRPDVQELALKTSLIITSFNYGDYVDRAIRSCLHQRHVDDSVEVVVVDDASTDHTRVELERYWGHPRVQLVLLERNVGVAAAANAGIRRALGQFVARVDADDFISESFVLMMQTYLELNHDAAAVACDYTFVDERENSVRRCSADREPIACGIMYRRDFLVTAGLYNEDFRHCEELELRSRLGDRYAVHHLRLPLYRYRLHGRNKSASCEYDEVRKAVDALRTGGSA
jgi:glycosyltransferase involved in cell wall biosynthesis